MCFWSTTGVTTTDVREIRIHCNVPPVVVPPVVVPPVVVTPVVDQKHTLILIPETTIQ